jgi:2-hydroxychromene-2-carboxylate isomerase
VSSPPTPVFYYDLGSPECYLAAERIMTALPIAPEWEPVLAATLERHDGDEGGDRDEGRDRRRGGQETPQAPGGAPPFDRQAFALRVAELGLQPLRWPSGWPPDTTGAMLAAAYAKRIGRCVAFSLAAFRQAFAGGRDLADQDTLLIAAAACEMHPTALLRALESRVVREALNAASLRARAAGVRTLPAIQLGAVLLSGAGAVERAAAALASRSDDAADAGR